MVFQSGPGFRVLQENKAGKSTSYLKHPMKERKKRKKKKINPRVLHASLVEPSRNFSMTFFLIGNYNSLKGKLFVRTYNCQWNFWGIRFLSSTTSLLVTTRQSSSQPANLQHLWHLLEMPENHIYVLSSTGPSSNFSYSVQKVLRPRYHWRTLS